MRFTETLAAGVRDLWQEAAEKSFVRGMAEGNLEEERFRRYMIQDYLYLQDYTNLLKYMKEYASDSRLASFFTEAEEATRIETETVHIPGMKRIGITDEDIQTAIKDPVIEEYAGYMRSQAEEDYLAGLVALLQCSWVYAYIGQTMTARYAKELARSPFKSWFEAYAAEEYSEANRMWIDTVDRETSGITQEEAAKLCRIFVRCAEYENSFWDVL